MEEAKVDIERLVNRLWFSGGKMEYGKDWNQELLGDKNIRFDDSLDMYN